MHFETRFASSQNQKKEEELFTKPAGAKTSVLLLHCW